MTKNAAQKVHYLPKLKYSSNVNEMWQYAIDYRPVVLNRGAAESSRGAANV
jgi:hypothetical protein